MRNIIDEGTMCQRERQLIKLALSYTVSNLDDVNEAFGDEEVIDGFIKLYGDNDSEIFREAQEQEILDLMNLFE